MKKTIKFLFKLITAIVSIGGILYLARDQVKEIIDKIRKLIQTRNVFHNNDFDSTFDDDFDDDDDEIFPDEAKDSRDYFTINITDDDEEKQENVTEIK
ncbi:MAG: DNA-directed RNA polymerase subunit delta [Anaerostipes sp.]|jgi:DNA-directed RNA polymerase subunit delta